MTSKKTTVGDTFISNDEDIRLKLPKWDNTLISITDYSIAEIVSDIVEDFKIAVFTTFENLEIFSNTNLLDKFDKFNNTDIYITENVSYPYLDEKDKVQTKIINVVMTNIASNKWNNILGVLHGYDIIIFHLPVYDETLLQHLKDIQGKFQEIYISTVKGHNDYFGEYPQRIITSTGERISMTYSSFLDILNEWYSTDNMKEFLNNKSFMPLLFPTNTIVPGEGKMDVNIILREEDLFVIGDRVNTDDNDVFPCTPYYNPRFLPMVVTAYEIILKFMGIYYADNEMYVIDYDLFFDNFIKNKNSHAYITRILMFFTLMKLTFHHDSLLAFTFASSSEYSEYIDEETRNIWFNS
jgi:hypothetical protein